MQQQRIVAQTCIGYHLLSNGVLASVIKNTWADGRVDYSLTSYDRNGYAQISIPQLTRPRIDKPA